MKKLVINPGKNDKVTMLNPNKALGELTNAILRIDSEDQFKPGVAKPDYVSRFLQKVEYKVTAVSKYSGRELNSYGEAVAYFNEIGTEIYGSKFWIMKYLKGEIERSPNQVFGLSVKNAEDLPEIKTMLKDSLADLFEIDSNGLEADEPAPTGELVIKSSKVRQKEAEEAAKKKAKADKSAAEAVLDEALPTETPVVPENQGNET